MKHKLLALLFVSSAWGQQTVAPSTETVGRSRGDQYGNYNVSNSLETGYRFRTAGGNIGKYRSDVNFGNGIRLLSGNLAVYSRDGQGRLFDELLINTLGLGNDPYQYASLRVQSNKLYRYDFSWRLSEYYNPALTISQGQHFQNTQRRMQDHDLVLLPQSPLQILAGYSRVIQQGPSLSTAQWFDARGDEFPLFSPVDRRQNEYRLGAALRFAGNRLMLMRGWQNYREQSNGNLTGGGEGNNPLDRSTLRALQTREPYEGNSPYWRFHWFTEHSGWYAVNAHFMYSSSNRNFLFDESATGTDRLGAARNRQLLAFGSGRRPVANGSLTLSFFPSSRLTLSNHTGFHQLRMEGDSILREFNNSTQRLDQIRFQLLAIRSIVNTTDANWQVARWAGLYGGYQFSTRRIRSREAFRVGAAPEGELISAVQDNRIHAGLAGIRLQPVTHLRITLDGEVGRADRPFYPVSEKNYNALSTRVQYRRGSLSLAAAVKSLYNNNSVSLFTHSSRSRTYSIDGSWSPIGWFSVDGGYSKLHWDSRTGIAYFANFALVENERSFYVSNVHAGNLGLRIAIRGRVDLYGGYSRVQDAGDGRPFPERLPAGVPPSSALPALVAAQSFPFAYESPMARVSVRLRDKLRWNFGYQHYRYNENFLDLQNYRAHTGFTSILWSF